MSTPPIVVPDVRWPAAAGSVAANRWSGPSAVAPFGKLETERSRDRVGFRQAQRQTLSDSVRLAALVPDEGLGRLVVAEIFEAEVFREHETVAAEVLDRREEAERLDPRNAAFDQLPDLVREERRDIAVDRFALGLHRAALEHRDLLP